VCDAAGSTQRPAAPSRNPRRSKAAALGKRLPVPNLSAHAIRLLESVRELATRPGRWWSLRPDSAQGADRGSPARPRQRPHVAPARNTAARAPIQWALLNDDAETGVTIMQIDEGLDTGAILTQQATPISASDNAPDAPRSPGPRMGRRAAPADHHRSGGRPDQSPHKQPEAGASYARKITKGGWPDRLVATRGGRSGIGCARSRPGRGPTRFCRPTPSPRLLKIWEAEVVDGAGDQASGSRRGSGRIVSHLLNRGCGSELQLDRWPAPDSLQFLAGHPRRWGSPLATSKMASCRVYPLLA